MKHVAIALVLTTAAAGMTLGQTRSTPRFEVSRINADGSRDDFQVSTVRTWRFSGWSCGAEAFPRARIAYVELICAKRGQAIKVQQPCWSHGADGIAQIELYEAADSVERTKLQLSCLQN